MKNNLHFFDQKYCKFKNKSYLCTAFEKQTFSMTKTNNASLAQLARARDL